MTENQNERCPLVRFQPRPLTCPPSLCRSSERYAQMCGFIFLYTLTRANTMKTKTTVSGWSSKPPTKDGWYWVFLPCLTLPIRPVKIVVVVNRPSPALQDDEGHWWTLTGFCKEHSGIQWLKMEFPEPPSSPAESEENDG